MPLAKGVVHCWASKLETLREDYEAEHGDGTFIGSAVWRATLAEGWREGICLLAHDHVGGHVFTEEPGGERERRKAS